MNMRKLSLSLLIVAGLMNSTWCTAGDQIVTEQELYEAGICLLINNEIIGSPEFLAVEKAFELGKSCIKKRMEAFNLCSAQGNCKQSVEFRLAIDEYNAAKEIMHVAGQKLKLKVAQHLKLETEQMEEYLSEAIIYGVSFK